MLTSERPTRDLLLECAERLFALYGIEAVSPRRIALAAGQRNQSAIRYHFGSKENLIAALLTQRLKVINKRRRSMLAELESGGRLNDVNSLVGAIAWPLTETVTATPHGTYYVRFLAHLFADRQRRDRLLARSDMAAPLNRVYQQLRCLNAGLPEALWNARLRVVVGGMINALADRERQRENGDVSCSALSNAAFTSNLIDSSAAILAAPASRATLALMETGAHPSRGEEREEKNHHGAVVA